VLATPLQIATGYAAMVNGGTVWRPRIVSEIRDADGEVIFSNPPTRARQVEIAENTVLELRRDMQQVVNNPSGTAANAFDRFGRNVQLIGGKTGTAQIIRSRTLADGTQTAPVNTALFAAVAPFDDPEWVVVIVVERGGSGGAVAAPTAVPVLQYLLNGASAVTDVRVGLEFLD